MERGIEPSEGWSRFSPPSNAPPCPRPISARNCAPAPENSRERDKDGEAPGRGSRRGPSLHVTREGLVLVCGMLGRSKFVLLSTWRHGGPSLLSWRQAHGPAFLGIRILLPPVKPFFLSSSDGNLLGQQTPTLTLLASYSKELGKQNQGAALKGAPLT